MDIFRPWISSGLYSYQIKFSKKETKKPTEENINSYKNFVHLYNKVRHHMKINYFAIMIEQNKSNLKQTYSILKKTIGKIIINHPSRGPLI